jgi:hypothetical protein
MVEPEDGGGAHLPGHQAPGQLAGDDPRRLDRALAGTLQGTVADHPTVVPVSKPSAKIGRAS